MNTLKKFKWTLILLGITTAIASAQVAFTINGVTDKTIGTSFTINIPAQSGYGYLALLNGKAIPVGTNYVVNKADYYLLSAFRTNLTTGEVTNRVIQFIVRNPERSNTEDGIPSWTPYPLIPSCDDEFAGGSLRIIVPKNFPTGYEIPVVAWVVDNDGHAIRVNGSLKVPGLPDIAIKRGVGSGFIPPQPAQTELDYSPSISILKTNFSIYIENEPTWTQVSGTITANTTWQQNSRIYITTNLTIASGATLTIEKGTVIRVNYRTDITNNGTIVINGTIDEPVVFMPNSRTRPWGGFVMRQGTGEITGTGVIFIGSGAEPNWFGANGNPGSHRTEQALFFIGNNQRVSLTDSAAIYMAGQLGHSVSGGILIFNRFLMQRCTTGGEYTGATFNVNDSAFIECPDDSTNFVDGDNDALYIVNNNHGFTNTLFGWTKDDGVDSGGSGAGVLHFSNCWFEATFHEGNSLSGTGKNVYHWNDVFIGCGQGLEAGYDAPNGYMMGCLAVNNVVGGRFGDNYDWTYNGSLTCSNSILIYNYRDVWGMNWDDWTYRVNQMNIQNNYLTVPNTNHPNNFIWNPETDAPKLAKFGAKGRVGIGFAVWSKLLNANLLEEGIPVGLSIFSTNYVRVKYTIESVKGVISEGTLVFTPGEVVKKITFPTPLPENPIYKVDLSDPENADITGYSTIYAKGQSANLVLIPRDAVWKYLDTGSDEGTAWRYMNYNDSSWKSGAAELGFGDGDEVTVINRYNANNQQIITYYFRRYFVVENPEDYSSITVSLRRDDGGIVYINGVEVFRSNMPSGTNITASTFASGSASDDGNTWYSTNFSPSLLIKGTNLCAVEIHQNNTTSSDVTFALELTALPQLRINIAKSRDEIILFWDDPSASLQTTDKINGTWSNIQTDPGFYVEKISDIKFFRLKK